MTAHAAVARTKSRWADVDGPSWRNSNLDGARCLPLAAGLVAMRIGESIANTRSRVPHLCENACLLRAVRAWAKRGFLSYTKGIMAVMTVPFL
jgi:hypothetical protein